MDIPNLHSDILNKLQTGVVVHGPDTQIVFSNARAEELLGLSQEQMQGKTAKDSAWPFVYENGQAMVVSDYPVNRVLASGKAIKGMVLGVNASAHPQTVWLLVSAFAQYSADGQLTQVVVDFHDISEIKRAQVVLQAQEAFTASVLDSLSEHIAVLDKDARIVAVNLAWRQFGQDNGASPKALSPIGMNYLDVCPTYWRVAICPTLHQRLSFACDVALARKKPMVLLEFSMTPSTKEESKSAYVARVIDVIDKSGLAYQLTPMGTIIEGDWAEVMAVVTDCFKVLESDCPRISSQIKIDYRAGTQSRMKSKTDAIATILGRKLST